LNLTNPAPSAGDESGFRRKPTPPSYDSRFTIHHSLFIIHKQRATSSGSHHLFCSFGFRYLNLFRVSILGFRVYASHEQTLCLSAFVAMSQLCKTNPISKKSSFHKVLYYKDLRKLDTWSDRKTNPIQTQFKPNQSQFQKSRKRFNFLTETCGGIKLQQVFPVKIIDFKEVS